MSALLDSLLTADELKTARAAEPADIGLTIAGEDAAAHARFVSLAGQDSRTARLMTQCAELRAELAEARQALADATSLTYSYAGLIGEQREQIAQAKTVQGIVNAIRALNSDYVTPGDMAAILAASGGLCDRLVKFGWRELAPAVEEIDWAHTRCQDEQNSRDGVEAVEA